MIKILIEQNIKSKLFDLIEDIVEDDLGNANLSEIDSTTVLPRLLGDNQ
ncbi:MAG: hypothetical protein R2865_11175 [Deinococcales bacterium]